MADPDNENRAVSLEIDGSNQDRESQLAIWRLVISGIHIFCNVTLLSMSYALRDGGWRGFSFFGIFFALAISSSVVISHIMVLDPTIRSYPDIGRTAFGIAGYRTVWIIVFLFTYACCVENTIVARDTLISLVPRDMLKMDDHDSEAKGVHIIIMLTVLVTIVIVLSREWGTFDITLTVGGLLLTAIVVLLLVWHWIFNHVSHQETLIFNPSMFPMAIGFYANCFASHSNLPDFYKQTKNRREFILLLIYIFVPTAILYIGVGSLGYHLFGNTVEALFVLSMPGHIGASAKICTIGHQYIRYLQGISSMATQIDEHVRDPQGDEQDNCTKSTLVRISLVATTIAISIVVPFYGPFMAFMASILGVTVALIIPYVCFLRIRYPDFTRCQVIWTVVVILIAVTGAIFGSIKSAPALAKG